MTITTPGLDSRTDNKLNTVYAGNHSARVNDAIQDYGVSVLSQKVTGYNDSLIAFAYAAVLEQSHQAHDSDAFIITLTDLTTNEILFSYNLNSATAPGVFTQSSSGWFYTDWVAQSIDVSGRKGHDFHLHLLANDCPYGGHAGYAYLDGFGSVLGGGGTGGGSTIPLLYWDGDQAGNAANLKIDGGDGIWTATKGNWTEQLGATNGAYAPNPGAVIFAGAAGTVTVDKSAGGISVSGMQFQTSGYTIKGDDIALVGKSVIQVGDGTPAASTFKATIDSSLTGTGDLQKTDLGTLILNGTNTYSGTTEVAAGTLLVNGSTLNSATTVNSGATIGGNGTVGSLSALTGSIVSPGASIGTLGVANGFTQATGSTYQLEVQSTGQTDKLNIAGTATIDTGAVLNVTKLDAPRYVLGTRYNVLTAQGGVTGRYNLTGNTKVSYFIDLVDRYNANNVFVDVAQTRSFTSAGMTPNQIAAGAGVDTKVGPLYTAIAYLHDQASAVRAFDLASGEVYATAHGATLEDSRFVRKAVIDRLTAREPDEKAFWFTPFGSNGRAGADANAAASKRTIGGAFAGWEVVKTPNWRVGFVGGYDHSILTVADRNSKAEFNDLHAGVYSGTVGDGFGARFGGALTERKTKGSRNMAITDFSDVVIGKYSTTIAQAFADFGYLKDYGKTTLEPYASVAYVDVNSKGDQEQGGAMALRLNKEKTDATIGKVGVRLTHDIVEGDEKSLHLRGMLGWRTVNGDRRPTTTLSFASGSNFTVEGIPTARNALLLDLGLEGKIGPRTHIGLSYSGLSGKNDNILPYQDNKFRDDSIFATVRYVFGGHSKAPAPQPYVPEPVVPEQPMPKALPTSEPEPQVQSGPFKQTFSVYFPFNSAGLSNEANRIILDASEFAKQSSSSTVSVIGHTDTAGSTAYNAALSRKRARKVAEALARRGVPTQKMSIGWKGENDLAVPTPDGVALERNRRTDIEVVQ